MCSIVVSFMGMYVRNLNLNNVQITEGLVKAVSICFTVKSSSMEGKIVVYLTRNILRISLRIRCELHAGIFGFIIILSGIIRRS